MLVGRYSLYSLFGLLLRPVFWLYNVFTYILLRSVGWEIDAKKAYENLPSNLKCGVYIHTYDSESLEQVAADDEIIHVRASLAYSLSPVKLFDKNKDSMRLERVKASNPHILGHDLSLSEIYCARNKSRSALDILQEFLDTTV